MSTTQRVSNIGSSETDRLKRELAEANEKLAAAEKETHGVSVARLQEALTAAQAEIERLKASTKG